MCQYSPQHLGTEAVQGTQAELQNAKPPIHITSQCDEHMMSCELFCMLLKVPPANRAAEMPRPHHNLYIHAQSAAGSTICDGQLLVARYGGAAGCSRRLQSHARAGSIRIATTPSSPTPAYQWKAEFSVRAGMRASHGRGRRHIGKRRLAHSCRRRTAGCPTSPTSNKWAVFMMRG